jgi:hypothetical protein
MCAAHSGTVGDVTCRRRLQLHLKHKALLPCLHTQLWQHTASRVPLTYGYGTVPQQHSCNAPHWHQSFCQHALPHTANDARKNYWSKSCYCHTDHHSTHPSVWGISAAAEHALLVARTRSSHTRSTSGPTEATKPCELAVQQRACTAAALAAGQACLQSPTGSKLSISVCLPKLHTTGEKRTQGKQGPACRGILTTCARRRRHHSRCRHRHDHGPGSLQASREGGRVA